jgi:hypothetical protein
MSGQCNSKNLETIPGNNQKRKYNIEFTHKRHITVEASSLDEASAQADNIKENEMQWSSIVRVVSEQ